MFKDLNKIYLSLDRTHHLYQGYPLYRQRFSEVLKYHKPGLAPAYDKTGWCHINLAGNPIYAERYDRTFGFYCDRAAVKKESKWFHLLADGKRLYSNFYAWCGNYQENKCVVRDTNDHFFHINLEGKPLYTAHYKYVGDFKDGIAVAQVSNDICTHIDETGQYIHGRFYQSLDVYHKNFARAKDENGWCHIDLKGVPIYYERYMNLEPFYNGIAFAEDKAGKKLLINEQGKVEKIIRNPANNKLMETLSDEIVGFWKTWVIYTFVKLGLPDLLPDKPDYLASKLKMNPEYVERLLRGIWELGLIELQEGIFHLTEKGKIFVPTKESSMAAAALMWVESNLSYWDYLPEIMLNQKIKHSNYFKNLTQNSKSQENYYRAIKGYAEKDYAPLLGLINWEKHQLILDVGGGTGNFIQKVLNTQIHLKGILMDLPLVIQNLVAIPSNLQNRLSLIGHDFFDPWPAKVDAIMLFRILHDWSDDESALILREAYKSLHDQGKVYICEMILEEKSPYGSLLDLNMMVTTTGKERNFFQWKNLLQKEGFKIMRVNSISPLLSLITVEKELVHTE